MALFQNQKKISAGGLTKLIKLKIGAKVILTVNIDMQDRLINGQVNLLKVVLVKYM